LLPLPTLSAAKHLLYNFSLNPDKKRGKPLYSQKHKELNMKNGGKRCWVKYNKSLVHQGKISFWIDRDLLSGDQHFEFTKGSPKFKLSIIQAGWIFKAAYGLTFRSLEGFFSRAPFLKYKSSWLFSFLQAWK
jgi:hypothetical protein